MSDLLAEAEDYERKALKKIKLWGFSDSIYDDNLDRFEKLHGLSFCRSKYDAAADRFKKAAICFELAKSWDKAGSTYMKSAHCYLKMGNKYDAAYSYILAGNCYKETSTKEAITCIEKAVNMFCDIGRLDKAAGQLKNIARLYESEENIEKTITYLEKATDFYQNVEMTTSARECKLKVAQFFAQLEQYPRAIETYEELARDSLETYKEYVRYSLKTNQVKDEVNGHLLNAGLCQLYEGDPVAITDSLKRYKDIATAIEEEYVSKFTRVVKEFESKTTLDPWKKTLLLRVKDKLKAKELEELT